MNIIVITADGHVRCRPDTTWEREDKDIYAPEQVSSYSYSPVLFARISKAGKCIGEKFVDRYYDAVNYGMLLYAATADEPSCEIMDHTSILPFPMYDRCTLSSADNEFRIMTGEDVIYSTAASPENLIKDALVKASRLVSVRIGDIVAVELAQAATLLSRAGGPETRLRGSFCENPLFDLKIIM